MTLIIGMFGLGMLAGMLAVIGMLVRLRNNPGGCLTTGGGFLLMMLMAIVPVAQMAFA